jgi:hypothetical protein
MDKLFPAIPKTAPATKATIKSVSCPCRWQGAGILMWKSMEKPSKMGIQWLVGGLEHDFFIFPYIGNNHSN